MTGRSDEKTGNGQTDRKKGTKERVHRVGTVTFGVVLILFGILFLLHLFSRCWNTVLFSGSGRWC